MTEQHTSPLSGLLVHGMDRFVAERGTGGRLVTARTAFDILGSSRSTSSTSTWTRERCGGGVSGPPDRSLWP